MAQVTRRKLLKLSGAGAVAAKTGGIAAILATGRAPAYAQTPTVHWIRWNDFVPASDQLLRRELLPECEKAIGVKVNLETVNGNDLQPRITSAIQSGAGPDLFMLFNNHPHLYAASAVDLVGHRRGHRQERRAAGTRSRSGNCNDGKKWLSMPFCIIGAMNAYRKSWFDEVGYSKYPETWDEYRDAGKKLKAKGHPIGQALGHSFGDPPTFAYPLMWSYGGNEVDESGKVIINSKETIESVKFMVAIWKEAFDEGGLAWDDSSNNRAFLSGTISLDAQRRLDLHRGDAQARPVQDREGRGPQYRHPARAAAQGAGRAVRHAHLRLAPDAELLEEPEGGEGLPALDAHAGELREVVQLTEGLRHRADGRVGEEQDVGGEPRHGCRSRSPAGSASCRAARACRTPRPAEVLSKYVIVDMYAKAIQGGTAEEAVAWAESELKKVYV